MSYSRSSLTWLYDVRDGATVRVRYDLARSVEVGLPEPWSEPPSKVNDEDQPIANPQICYRGEHQREQTRDRVRRYRARRVNGNDR